MSPKPWCSACLDGLLLPGCSPSLLAAPPPSKAEGEEGKAIVVATCLSWQEKSHLQALSVPSIFSSPCWPRLLFVRGKFE